MQRVAASGQHNVTLPTQVANHNRIQFIFLTEMSCPLGTTHCVPQEELLWKPYNNSFVDQACSIKMAGFLFYFFPWVYGPRLCLSS